MAIVPVQLLTVSAVGGASHTRRTHLGHLMSVLLGCRRTLWGQASGQATAGSTASPTASGHTLREEPLPLQP